MEFRQLINPGDVDLDRDGLMEASAGTGKTYTIEKLVCRLIIEKQVPIEKILVVTYTEKAAGEMAHRIRRAIRNAAEQDPQNSSLAAAVTDFDMAQISTIHSFCYRLIREFAFEMGLPWALSMVDDDDTLEKTIHHAMRRDWARNKVLGEYFREEPGKDVESVRVPVLQSARLYNPKGGDRLTPMVRRPASLPQFLANETASVERATQLQKRLEGLVSFKDMLILLTDALEEDDSLMMRIVRERYSHAFVDEFQDTDPVQWRIFRDAFLKSHQHRLYLVGDPKQAIYAFRGGDVHTYLHAREELKESGGNLYTLATNWRSTPEMIEAFNVLFSVGDWFPSDDGIEHHDAESPSDPRNKVVTDKTRRSTVTMIQLDDIKMNPAKIGFAKAIAREIVLLTKRKSFVYRSENEDRALSYDDIAILVDKRVDARFLEKVFNEAGIPHTFYKKQGIYLSDEARQVWALLSGLVDPSDANGFRKALLSSFMDCPAASSVDCLDWPVDHPLRRLYGKWRTLAETRDWPRFFRSLEEDSGLLVRLAGSPGNDRSLTNFRQILEDLELQATRRKMSLVELSDYLTGLRRETEEFDPDQSIHRMETEDPKVQIMTIHTAKGLEFPIVFVFAGLSARPNRGVLRYHSGDTGYVINFDPDVDAKSTTKADIQREWRRLYYVAITRAIYKVYLPVYQNSRAKGPLTSLLREPLMRLSNSTHAGTIDAPLHGYVPQADESLARRQSTNAEFETLPVEPLPWLGNRARFRTSFTHLKDRLEASHHPVVLSEQTPEPEDPHKAHDEKDDPRINEFQSVLPRGARTGNVLHYILEKIDFGHFAGTYEWDMPFKDPALKSVIVTAMNRFGLCELDDKPPGEGAISREIAMLVYTAITLDLPADDGGTFKLTSVTDRIVEVDFTMAIPAVATGCDIAGYVDLVFRRQDRSGNMRYHILDWKSNTLDCYDEDAVHNAMVGAGYDLQCRIYNRALDHWLSERLGSSYNREHHLGGSYYIFLRGLREETMDGIWHAPPMRGDEPDHIDEELARLVAARGKE